MKTLCIFVSLAFISASLSAQKTKTVTVYDSPDHSEWHTVEYSDSQFAPYEFGFDLSLLDKRDSLKAEPSQPPVRPYYEVRDSIAKHFRDSVLNREAALRKFFWPDDF